MTRSRQGFTLVELLVVIAIVTLLSGVVLASTTISRSKARDASRISDMKEIQLGLAVYYDVYKSYPASLTSLTSGKFLPSIPTDPLGGSAYEYLVTNGKYCIGVTLESTIPTDGASCTSAASGSTANYKAQPNN